MKTQRFLIAGVIAALLAPAAPAAEPDKKPLTIVSVLQKSRRKEKVLIAGKISKAITLDLFALGDGTGELLLDASNVRVSLAVDKEIVVWGRFWGRSEKRPAYAGELEAIEIADAGSEKAAALLAAHGAVPTPVPAAFSEVGGPSPTPAPVDRSVESRLKTLDELKKKGLVTDEEYQSQRKRILSEL